MRNRITDAAIEGHYRDMFEASHGFDPLDPFKDGCTEDDLDELEEYDEEEERE